MKRSLLIFAVCLAILATLLSGCATKLSLYKKGLEITAIMEEMLDCQAFSKLYQTTDFSDILRQSIPTIISRRRQYILSPPHLPKICLLFWGWAPNGGTVYPIQ